MGASVAVSFVCKEADSARSPHGMAMSCITKNSFHVDMSSRGAIAWHCRLLRLYLQLCLLVFTFASLVCGRP